MSIYTKTGDKGSTALFGGARISKAHPQVSAYGTIDELTSMIGLCRAVLARENSALPGTQAGNDGVFLEKIQRELYEMMALLAGAKTPIIHIEQEIEGFEDRIDTIEKSLPKLTRFIIPGGTELSGWFHVLRTTARRAERETVAFFTGETPHTIDDGSQRIMLKYLNRLSDLFFMMARQYSEGNETVT
jgi:cob(I)alamin adenosyltransferase